MNTDCFLERGRDHAMCEDFAAADVAADQAFALVSDGCSSSENVDFGARILVHAARDVLTPILASGGSLDAVSFAEATIGKAGRVLGCFAAMPHSTLDATLLLALVRPVGVTYPPAGQGCWESSSPSPWPPGRGRTSGPLSPKGCLDLANAQPKTPNPSTPDSGTRAFKAQVCFWGDGVALVRKQDRVLATLLRFAGNAPFYLSYALNAPRRQAYLERQGGQREILRVSFGLEGTELLRDSYREDNPDPLAPHQEQFDLEPGDSLALVSDGITQFYASDNSPVAWETLAPKLVEFKRPAGVFVRRRMNFFERENSAAGVRHLDDLAVAAVTV